MSAAEIIEMIEKLPPQEQRQVRDYLDKKIIPEATGIRRIDLEKGKKIGEGVFDRHPEVFRKLAQ